MRLVVRSSGKTVEIPSETFNKLSKDQQRSYMIIDRKDTDIPSEQVVVNEVVNDKKKK